jgi:hypothetical protein
VAEAHKSKKENRYPGVDTVPWKIVEASGSNPTGETFAGFNQANAAALRFTQETGSWAAAVRA